MSKTLVVVALAGAIGVGVFLYVRKARGASIPMTPQPSPSGVPGYAVTGVPERVADKRYAGATMAASSSSYDPALPASVNASLDVYKRGADVVGQGKTAYQAAAAGDVGGALSALGGAASSAGGFLSGGNPKANPPRSSLDAPKAGVDYRVSTGPTITGAKTVNGVSSVRDQSGNVFSADKFGSTSEFQALRAAADAVERKANVGAGHF